MEKKTFREYYDSLSTESPKGLFIKRIAKATFRSESTVRMWLSGRQRPDELARKMIELELGIPSNILFPEK
ncbi:MAG: hypothetical protein LIO79_08210 [Rikenellaceae bacterium]|nr:hypothetical protein [Rikenellaceae bacterium]